VKVSEPLIAFRETVLNPEAAPDSGGNKNAAPPALPPPWCDISGLSLARSGRYRVVFGTTNVALTVRCFPLHPSFTRVMEEHASVTGEVDDGLSELHRSLHSAQDSTRISEIAQQAARGSTAKFWADLHSAIVSPKNETDTEVVDGALSSAAAQDCERQRFLSIGSQQHCTNVLTFGADVTASVWRGAVPATTSGSATNYATVFRDAAVEPGALLGKVSLREAPVLFYKLWSRLHSACTAAFRMAVEAGPLMREPMHAVGFCIEDIEFSAAVMTAALTPAECELVSRNSPGSSGPESPNASGNANILTGQLISELREALHVAALSLPVRIVEPVYKCDLQCDQSQLGNLYGVLAQRRGEVTSEDVIEGTTLFLLSAHLPVQSSFGFAQQLLKRTSGLGTAPQLSFSHWSRVETDPFW
jgi:translation elongation factor EF-G